MAAPPPTLPYAHLNLRRNPFGEPATEERIWLAVVDVEDLAGELRDRCGTGREPVTGGSTGSGRGVAVSSKEAHRAARPTEQPRPADGGAVRGPPGQGQDNPSSRAARAFPERTPRPVDRRGVARCPPRWAAVPGRRLHARCAGPAAHLAEATVGRPRGSLRPGPGAPPIRVRSPYGARGGGNDRGAIATRFPPSRRMGSPRTGIRTGSL